MDSPGWIRIIDLLPGDDGSDIYCTMRTSRIESGEPYEALSYVWGRDTNSRHITTSGQNVTITQNLYDALKRLRGQSTKRSLWIDQLCINQKNSKEKTHQVNMRKIYKTCTQCVIWLGEIPKQERGLTIFDAQGAIDYICFWAEISERPGLDIPASLSTAQKRHAASKAFQALFLDGNAWWSRIWTVQEAVLPPKANFQWGPLTLDWSMVRRAALNMCIGHPPFCRVPDLRLGDSNLNDDFLAPVRGLQIAMDGEDPLNLFQRWRHRDATDPRDKVYGLMGLFPTMPLPSVQSCDYQATLQALYTNVTIDLIQLEQGLRPLVGLRRQTIPNLPTWVIDLSKAPGISASDWWWDHSHRYQWFNADGGQAFMWEILRGGSVLSLTGVYVDRIEEVGDVLCLASSRDSAQDEIAKLVQSWREVMIRYLKSHPPGCKYPYGDSWDTAFWMTMIGDLITSEFPIRRGVLSDRLRVLDFYENGAISEMTASLRSMTVNQAFFITNTGFIGIGPPTIEKGDEVWVLYGSRVPFILKPSALLSEDNGSKECTLAGNAFVYGKIDSEATDLQKPQRTVHIY